MEDYNDGEFHIWHGGGCPVHPRAVVDVRFRSSEKTGVVQTANCWEWYHTEDGLDIVMLRVVTPHRAPVYLPETIGPDHPAVKAFRAAYNLAYGSSGYDRNGIAAGLTAVLKMLREGEE